MMVLVVEGSKLLSSEAISRHSGGGHALLILTGKVEWVLCSSYWHAGRSHNSDAALLIKRAEPIARQKHCLMIGRARSILADTGVSRRNLLSYHASPKRESTSLPTWVNRGSRTKFPSYTV